MISVITIAAVVMLHHTRKDGSCLVKFRVTHNRKSAYLVTPFVAAAEQLSAKGNIIDPYLEIQVTEDRIKAQKHLSADYARLSTMTVQDIAREVSDYLYGVKMDDILLYVPFARKVIERKMSVPGGNWKNYELSLNKIINFVGHERFYFNDITLNFIQNYDRYLEQSGIGPRGRNLYLSNLRATLNEAKLEFNDEDRGAILIPGSPFNRFKMPRSTEISNAALTIEQIRAIRDVNLVSDVERMARDVFMLSFYLVGMNSVDMYNLSSIADERLVYYRAKTTNRRSDSAMISIKIEKEAQEIINNYLSNNPRVAFIFADKYSTSEGFNAYVNKYLKRIGAKIGIPNLILYSARHSWATIFVNECGGSEAEAAFCLNHVSEHKVTSRYIKKDFSRIDNANRKVLDKVSNR